MERRARRRLAVLPALTLACALVAACTTDAEPPDDTDYSEVLGTADCKPYQPYGWHDDAEIHVVGGIGDVEETLLETTWRDFERCTGIDVDYEPWWELEGTTTEILTGEGAPGIALLPQPGLIAELAEQGALVPAPPDVVESARASYRPDTLRLGQVGDQLYGIPLLMSIKGMVWYSPRELAARGLSVPGSLEELLELTRRLTADTKGRPDTYKPWCAGFESGTSSGWPGTDWIEAIVLQQSGADAYQAWSTGELPFDSPEVRGAFTVLGALLRDPQHANGGTGVPATIADTYYRTAGLALPPGRCSLFLSSSYYESQWRRGTTVAPDGDVWAFPLPSGMVGGRERAEVSGDLAVALADDEATLALYRYLASPAWARRRVELGGVMTPHLDVPASAAGSAVLRDAMSMLQSDRIDLRFDASDEMPPAANQAFMAAMQDWIRGADTDRILRRIDRAWPGRKSGG